MQLIESSALGLRSARWTLSSASSDVAITIFPMVHLGDAAFYKVVYDDAGQHDAMLVEGINSPIVTRITRAYRWIEGSKRIGLSAQPRHPLQSMSHATIIHADLSPVEFAQHWRKVPLYQQLMLYAGAPAYALYCRWLGSRASIAKDRTLDDLQSSREILSWSPEWLGFDNAVMRFRDERLVAVMNEYIDAPSVGPRRLAIVYGAKHMRAVLKELTGSRGFRVVKGEWLTIFEL